MRASIEKSGLLIMLIALISVYGCKKEDNPDDSPATYAEITRDHIAAKAGGLSDATISATDINGHVIDAPDVFIYKTRNNHYGKLQIVSIDDADNFKLTFQAVTFNDDGTILSQTTGIGIRGTWLCDLDSMTETDSATECDFHWERVDDYITNLLPKNSALFARYEF